MKKVICSFILMCTMFVSINVFAQDAYINNVYTTCEIKTLGYYDMFPAYDLSAKMGAYAEYNEGIITFWYGDKKYTLTENDPKVWCSDGNLYWLDVVPQFMDGELMIPSQFLTAVLNISVSWDSVTRTIFINSDAAYEWLINTPEYQETINNTWMNVWFDDGSYYTIQYPNNATIHTYYSDGDIMNTVRLDYIELTSIYKDYYWDEFTIYFNLQGVTDDTKYCYFDVSFYNADGYCIGGDTVIEQVSEGSYFNIIKSVKAPTDTVKIVFEEEKI